MNTRKMYVCICHETRAILAKEQLEQVTSFAPIRDALAFSVLKILYIPVHNKPKLLSKTVRGRRREQFPQMVTTHQFFVRVAKSEVVLARSIRPVHCTRPPGAAAFRCNTQVWKTSLQCATRHSLLQYSLSHTRDSAAGLGQPLRMHRSRPPGTCC